MHAPTCILAPLGGRVQARRHKVTEAARKLFAAHGFHNTGMAQIAAASDVKVGQIYRDFPSKEAIVEAIVEADFSTFVDSGSLHVAVEQGDKAGVMTAIERLFDPAPCDEIMPEILAEASRNPRIAEIVGALDTRFIATLTDALAVFAPGPDTREQRAHVAEVILVLVIGMGHRTVSHSTSGPLSAPVRATILREIEALATSATAR
jgi:AcrR family transcriptional regulator